MHLNRTTFLPAKDNKWDGILKKNEPFLDGCKVFLSGIAEAQLEELKNVYI